MIYQIKDTTKTKLGNQGEISEILTGIGVAYRNENDSETAILPETHPRVGDGSQSWKPEVNGTTFRASSQVGECLFWGHQLV